jgi:hypothetical protein
MKSLTIMRTDQAGKFARFLDEHPGFSPDLTGENADVCGFRVGECLLSVDEMERLIDTQVHFDARQAALLRLPLITIRPRRSP